MEISEMSFLFLQNSVNFYQNTWHHIPEVNVPFVVTTVRTQIQPEELQYSAEIYITSS
jgi:hypothetical protein